MKRVPNNFSDSNTELDVSRFEFLENEIDHLKEAISRRDATLREYRYKMQTYEGRRFSHTFSQDCSMMKQVLANKDASPFLRCFVLVVVVHGCYGNCGLCHCCGGYLDACELLLSLLLIFYRKR